MPERTKAKKTKFFNKNIGLFGASFDPPHRGHLAVIKHLLTKDRFDELWLTPTYKHPFGKTLTNFSTRISMLKCLLRRLNPLCPYKISQIEKTIPQRPTYTWHVIKALKKRHPKYNFTLVVGTDVRKELKKWHKIHELKKMVNFYFVPRKGFEKSSFPEVSSSEIREKSKKGKSIKGLTTKEVERFILKNKLYASRESCCLSCRERRSCGHLKSRKPSTAER